MATKIDSVSAREKLKLRREPFWHRLSKGCFLGYRKMIAGPGGSWVVRALDEASGKQIYSALGDFSDSTDHLRFDIAQKAAQAWLEHRRSGGSATTITVGEACSRYVQKQRDEGKEAGAKDLEGRFKRWMHCDKKLSSTPMTKLTQGQISDWRVKITRVPAILQDKTKKGAKPKAASSINREMAVFKAALNLALRDGYVTNDSAWKYKLLPIKNATGRRDCYLDINQRRALIAHAPADLAGLVRAMALIPLRPGAVAALTVGNFDNRLRVLTVGKDKAGQDRKITLPASTAAFFSALTNDKLPGEPLCAKANGAMWDKDSWKYPFKEAVIAAGLPLSATAYALRHSTITDLISVHRLDVLTVAILSGTSISILNP